MKIGIKYCGGCNNQYDRTAFLEKIKETFPEAEYEYASEEEIYDVVVFLQGCEKMCASRNYQATKGFFDVKPSTLNQVLEQLKEVING